MELATKGKKLLIATAITLLTLELIWIFVHFFIGFEGVYSERAGIVLMQDALAFVSHCLFLVLVYEDHRWAKWVAATIVAIAIAINFVNLSHQITVHIKIFGLPIGLYTIPTYYIIQALLIAVGIFAICVLLRRPVRAYQNQVKPSTADSQPPILYGQAPMPYQPGQPQMPYQMAPVGGFVPQYPMTPTAPVTAMPPATPVPQPDTTWACTCGTANQGRFCSNCGQPKPTT